MPHKGRVRSSATSTPVKPFRPQFITCPPVIVKSTMSSHVIYQVVSIVKSTLGPRGMDKLIEEGSGTTITNDGATVMKKLNIVPSKATCEKCTSQVLHIYIYIFVSYFIIESYIA